MIRILLMVVTMAHLSMQGWEFDPMVKGVWPAYGPANAKGVAVDGGYVYVAAGEAGLLVYETSDASKKEPVGRLALPGSASSIALAGDYAYVSNEGIGSDAQIFTGLHVVDLRQRGRPVEVAFYKTTGRAVQVAVSGEHAVIVDQGYLTDAGYRGAGLEVLNIRNPELPKRMGRIDARGEVRTVSISGDLLVAVEKELQSLFSQLSVIELAGPEGPRQLARFPLSGSGVGIAFQGTRAYVAHNLGFEVIDLSRPDRPQKVGETWLDGNLGTPMKIELIGSNAMVVTVDGLTFVDLSNPRRPVQKGIHSVTSVKTSSEGLPTGVAMSGSRLYRAIERFRSFLSSDTGSLLEVIDVSDVDRPVLAGVYVVGVDAKSVALSGSNAFVAGGFSGMYVVDVADLARPRLISNHAVPGEFSLGVGVEDVAIAGNLACLREWSGFEMVDVADLRNPRGVGRYLLETGKRAAGLSVVGNLAYLYVQGDSQWLEVIDITNREAPRRLIQYDIASWADRLPVGSSLAFTADADEGWWIDDIRDPALPMRLGGYRSIVAALGWKVFGGQAHDTLGGIYDISNPAKPRLLGQVSHESARAVSRSGNILCSVGSNDSRCYDVSNPAAPRLLSRFSLRGAANDIALQGRTAFVAAARWGLVVGDLSPVDDPNGTPIPVPIEAQPKETDVVDVAVTGDRAFVVDTRSSLKILDVQSPGEPVVLGQYVATGSLSGVAAVGRHVFLCGDYGMEICDVSQPTQPLRVSRVNTSSKARSVQLEGDHAILFLEGQWDASSMGVRGAGLDVIDVRDPANPRRMGGFETEGSIAAGTVDGKVAFLATMTRYQGPPWNWSSGGVDIVDLSDPATPRRIGRYATSGPAVALSKSDGLLCVIDSGVWKGWDYSGAHLAVLDVTEPASPKKIGEYPIKNSTVLADVALIGHYAFLVLPSEGGLHVLDLSDPTRPRRIHSPFSLGAAQHLAVVGSTLYVASRNFGMAIVDISAPTQPKWLGGYWGGGYPQQMASGEGFAVAGGASGGLAVMELSNPRQPSWVGFHATQGKVRDIAIGGRFAYAAEGWAPLGVEPVGGQLSVVNLTELARPRLVGQFPLDGTPLAVAVAGNRVCLALGPAGLRVGDVADPTAPRSLGGFDTDGDARDVDVQGNFAYVADGKNGFHIVDISNPPNFPRVGGHATGGSATQIAVNGHYVHVWDRNVGVLRFDVADPAHPRFLDPILRVGEGGDVRFSGAYAAVVDNAAGCRVFDLRNPDALRLIASASTTPDGSSATIYRGYLYVHVHAWSRLDVAELPAFFRSIEKVGGGIRLEWEGWGRSRLEAASRVSKPDWQDLGIPESANDAALPSTDPHAFFRLRRR